MAEIHLSQDEFFNKLGELFASSKGKDTGSIYLSQKRLSQNRPTPSKDDPLADITATLSRNDDSPSPTYPVLVRATNGKSGKAREAGQRVKLATVVESDALDSFYVRYAEICKAGMLALKPRDRSKRKTKSKKKKSGAA